MKSKRLFWLGYVNWMNIPAESYTREITGGKRKRKTKGKVWGNDLGESEVKNWKNSVGNGKVNVQTEDFMIQGRSKPRCQ